MTIKNAIKYLSKFGTVEKVGPEYRVLIGKHYVSFLPNGSDTPENEITCQATRHIDDHDEPQSDYCAHIFAPSLKKAVERAQQWQ